MVLINDVSSDMDLILLTDMSLWMAVLIYTTISILPYIGITWHFKLAITGLKYLLFATNSPEPITCPWMVIFYLRLYGEDVNSTIQYPCKIL